MTVISGIKFMEHNGIIVSDEQASYGVRKSDISTKVEVYRINGEDAGDLMFTGGTGASDFLYDVENQFSRGLEDADEVNGLSVLDLLGRITHHLKRQYVDGYLREKFGISETEFQLGMKQIDHDSARPISEQNMAKYHQFIDNNGGEIQQLLNSAFLSLVFSEGKVDLYRVGTNIPKPMPVSTPFETLGSGADIADYEISSFFERIDRDRRENLSPIEALSILLHATERASARNIGVGGIPQIAILYEGEVVEPSPDSSKLATEIVKGYKRGFLHEEFHDLALKNLILEKGEVRPIEEAMWNESTSREDLSKLLRGYNI
jgi:hypothetical protein